MPTDHSSAATTQHGSGVRAALRRLRAKAMFAVSFWGTTENDLKHNFPCDQYVQQPHAHYYRAIDIQASAEVVYRWLCQLRIAPYSYDWIDNYCRRSPRRLIPGVDDLRVGQRWFLKIFELVEFEPGRRITLRIARARWFWGSDVGATYLLLPYDEHRCRVVVNVVTHANSGVLPELRRRIYPWGELLMMRKQLITFKRLAEKHARAGVQNAGAISAARNGDGDGEPAAPTVSPFIADVVRRAPRETS